MISLPIEHIVAHKITSYATIAGFGMNVACHGKAFVA